MLINSIIKKQEFFAFFKRKTPLFFKKIRTNSPKLCTKKIKNSGYFV